MTGLRKRLPETRRGMVVGTYLAAALVFGGGGSPSAAAEIIVQLVFALCAIAWLWWARAADDHAPKIARPLVWLGAMIIVLPIVQVIPLPPGLWQALPGRGLASDALAVIGARDGWRPMSVAPYMTLAAILAIVPAVGAMLAAATLTGRDRRFVLLLVAMVGIAGAALGVLQMASGPGEFRLYEVSHDVWLTAFHASRNSAADGLLIGSLALTAWFASTAGRRPVLRSDVGIVAVLQIFLIVALALTGSRAGIALLPLVLLVQYAMLRSTGVARQLSNGLAAAGALAALVAGAAVMFSGNSRLDSVLARFDASRDSRVDLWQDTLTAIGQYWPWGSGVGTFTRTFLPVERVETLDDLFPNRAHNDYLEFLLEAGALAPLILLAGLGCLAWLARRAWNAHRADRPAVLFALGTFMVIGLHSFVDYPLRNMAIASLAGVAAGLLGAIALNASGRQEMDALE